MSLPPCPATVRNVLRMDEVMKSLKTNMSHDANSDEYTIRITRDDARRLLSAIDEIEGDDRYMFYGVPRHKSYAWVKVIRAHKDLKKRLEDFIGR